MAVRTCLRKAGEFTVRRLVLLLVGVLIVSGCDSGPPAFLVKAVAAGVPSLAPFFEENGELGEDVDLASEPPHSGLQQGNAPGLYGGSRKPAACDVDRLKEFLADPENRQKAREWAGVIGVDPATDGRIEEYLDTLTPVLLRHDTLVVNHDYKKGRAVAFNALLESGIAVLVDGKGLPAVKCSCGNPLRAVDGNRIPEDIEVRFDNGNNKWDGYDESAVVAVKPAPQPLDRIVLIDVDDPEKGISRPAGSEGERDSAFAATDRHRVPRVSGMTFGAAGQKLAARGLAVAFSGDELPSGDARVTGSRPGAGTELRFGEAVLLSVRTDDGPPGRPATGGPTTGESPTGEPSKGGPSKGGPSKGRPSKGRLTTGGPTDGTPATGEPTTGGPTTDEPPTSEPPSKEPTSADPTTGRPPTDTPTNAPTDKPTTAPPDGPTPTEPTGAEPGPNKPAPSSPTSGKPTLSDFDHQQADHERTRNQRPVPSAIPLRRVTG